MLIFFGWLPYFCNIPPLMKEEQNTFHIPIKKANVKQILGLVTSIMNFLLELIAYFLKPISLLISKVLLS